MFGTVMFSPTNELYAVISSSDVEDAKDTIVPDP